MDGIYNNIYKNIYKNIHLIKKINHYKKTN